MNPITYGSVCSGIEAATAAWHPLGWRASFFSEIEPFPRAVLNHHYPNTPLHGDFTTIPAGLYEPIDLLVGGTPCQAFSVAGLRKGLDDPRGNLTLAFLGLANRLRPRWLVWENVPGVLSIDGGKTFGTFLGGLGELGYGFAYRILDAQYFGVAQRRRRVFVVGYLGDWRRAASVLFERDCLFGNPPPSREKGQSVAGTIAARFGISRNNHEECVATLTHDCAPALTTRTGTGTGNSGMDEMITATIAVDDVVGCMAHQAHGGVSTQDALSGYIQPVMQPICFEANMSLQQPCTGEVYPTITRRTHASVALPIPFGVAERPEIGHCLRSGASKADKHESTTYVAQPMVYDKYNDSIHKISPTIAAANTGRVNGVLIPNMAVRRLTPVECERLQGFPDNFTRIPWRKKSAEECPDGPRYKALGNSMAVPVMRWIGQRIQAVDQIP